MPGNKNSGKGWRRDKLVAEVRDLLEKGHLATSISDIVGVSNSAISMAAFRLDPKDLEIGRLFDVLRRRKAVDKKREEVNGLHQAGISI